LIPREVCVFLFLVSSNCTCGQVIWCLFCLFVCIAQDRVGYLNMGYLSSHRSASSCLALAFKCVHMSRMCVLYVSLYVCMCMYMCACGVWP